MKKSYFDTIIIMEMCMRICRMCMAFCVSVSDMFSVSEVNTQAAY